MPAFEDITVLEMIFYVIAAYWAVGTLLGIRSVYEFLNSGHFTPPMIADPVTLFITAILLSITTILLAISYPAILLVALCDILQTSIVKSWRSAILRWHIFWFLLDCKRLIQDGTMKGEPDTQKLLSEGMWKCFQPWQTICFIDDTSMKHIEKEIQETHITIEENINKLKEEKKKLEEEKKKITTIQWKQ